MARETKESLSSSVDILRRSLALQEMMVQILATGEPADAEETFFFYESGEADAAPSEKVVLRLYRATGATGGIVLMLDTVNGQKPFTDVFTLDALAHRPRVNLPMQMAINRLVDARGRAYMAEDEKRANG